MATTPFDISSLPGVKEAQAKAAAAAATKAAYDAIPYSQHLAEAKAAATSAKSAYDAYKPDPASQDARFANIPGLANLNNPNRQAMTDAQAAQNKLITSHLQSQLNDQASRFGFGWKGNKDADYHTGLVAGRLSGQGIEDLSQLGYSKDQNYLINKDTGKQLDWYKSAKHPDEGPLANKGQLGWGAKGVGRTNYMVKADAGGNPIIFPEWKSNAPTGLGGFLLQAAPALVSMIPGIGPAAGAALQGYITSEQGGNLGDIIKSAGMTYAGGKIAPNLSNMATANLPMLGNAALTNIAADALGQAGAGGIGSLVAGKGLSGVLPGLAAGAAGSAINSSMPSSITGISGIDSRLPGVATGTANQVIAGKDLGTALTNSAIGAAGQAAGQQVASLVPNTGSNYVNGLLQNVAGTLSGSALTNYLHQALPPGSPNAPAPKAQAPVSAAAPVNTAGATNQFTNAIAPLAGLNTATASPVNNQGNLLNYLSLAQMGGQQAAPAVASNIPAFSLDQMFSTMKQPSQGSLQQLLQSYNQGKVA